MKTFVVMPTGTSYANASVVFPKGIVLTEESIVEVVNYLIKKYNFSERGARRIGSDTLIILVDENDWRGTEYTVLESPVL